MITTSIKVGAAIAVLYLGAHFGSYLVGQSAIPEPSALQPGERPMYPVPGLPDNVFARVNAPALMVLGSYSLNAIAAVNTSELLVMAVVGLLFYGFAGFMATYILLRLRTWF